MTQLGVDNTPVERAIHNVVVDVAFKAALDGICASVPFLNLPVVHEVFLFLANKLVNRLYAELAKRGMFILIDSEEIKKNEEYQNALLVLKTDIATGVDSEKALAEFKLKFQALVRVNTKPR